MKLILSKKINGSLVAFMLYLSFCFSEFYFSRGSLAYSIVSLTGLSQAKTFSNNFFAFFIGGAVPFAFYEIITRLVFSSSRKRLGFASDDCRYALRYFYFSANILIGLISLTYFITPLISVYGGILVPFIITTVFFVLFLIFICRNYFEKYRISSVIMQFGCIYLVFYAAITGLNILGGI